MIIRRRINGGEWEEIEVEIGVIEGGDWDMLEDDDDGGIEPLMCMYCSSPAATGHYTCGRASCVEREIVAQIEGY
jgi:hypothetical protein